MTYWDGNRCKISFPGGKESGKTERFHGNPARWLKVEPDPQTGEMRPMTDSGRPADIYLCWEERDLQ